jgi:hypothetical protein
MATSSSNRKQSNAPVRSRNGKALYLPMDRAAADAICLPIRLALEAIRQKRADQRAANYMAQVILLTRFLTKAGHGGLDIALLAESEAQLSDLLTRGKASNDWTFSESLIEHLTIIVNEHDRQIRECRLKAIVNASNAVDRLIMSKRS